jgi:hypothetical protein
MSEKKDTNINVRLDSEIVSWLKVYSKLHGDMSVSSVVRMSLDNFRKIFDVGIIEKK